MWWPQTGLNLYECKELLSSVKEHHVLLPSRQAGVGGLLSSCGTCCWTMLPGSQRRSPWLQDLAFRL
jgi:hypothetical protein